MGGGYITPGGYRQYTSFVEVRPLRRPLTGLGSPVMGDSELDLTLTLTLILGLGPTRR